MYAKHPKIAKRWREESGPQRDLPEHKRKGKKKQSKAIEHLKKMGFNG